jgi:hypothetical protein
MAESAEAKPTPKPKRVTIFVNNNEVVLPDAQTTGAQIKEAAGVPLDFTLYLKHGDKLEEIRNEQDLKVHDREQFIAVSGQDVS